jgi:hypothetical protein
MTTYTLDTVVTEDISTENIVAFMLDNGSPAKVGETYITDWIEEGDPVGMTLGQLMAEWIE